MLRKFLFLVCLSFCQCYLEDKLSIETRFSALEARVKQLEADSAKCPCVDAVWFNVQLKHDMSPLALDQHIIFDNVISNIGGCYDIYSGHFTAPLHGLYSFVVSFTKMVNHNLSVRMVKNGDILTRGITNPVSVFDTANISATVELEKGDKVWAESAYPAGDFEAIHGDWTYFSGHLVMPMPSST